MRSSWPSSLSKCTGHDGAGRVHCSHMERAAERQAALHDVACTHPDTRSSATAVCGCRTSAGQKRQCVTHERSHNAPPTDSPRLRSCTPTRASTSSRTSRQQPANTQKPCLRAAWCAQWAHLKAVRSRVLTKWQWMYVRPPRTSGGTINEQL